LLVDDEPNLRKVLGALLQQAGYEVHAEADGEAALLRVKGAPSGTFDAVITDLRMPRMGGMALLRELSTERSDLPVIILTAHGSVDTAVEAVKSGAFDFLEKPFDREQIHQVVAKAIATHERAGPTADLPAPPPTPPQDGQVAEADANAVDHDADRSNPGLQVGMVGRSEALRTVHQVISTVAASPSTVLVTGESGTGKELVARALHLGSDRRDRPFIRVNCAAIPAGLVESELFGHERGAFTGAVSSRAGRFELADGGTLFLDEVSEIPLEIQVKLLRAIQESEFERVGGIKTLSVDVRLIAATNRDLEEEITEKRFREDLYYRLNVVPVHLPALRERPEDIPPLLDHFVKRSNDRLGKGVVGFADDALEVLRAYGWPGNIRELENLVERMVLFASGEHISLDELPEAFHRAERESEDGEDGELGEGGSADSELAPARHIRLPLSSLGLDLKEAVKAGSRLVEEALIREALEKTDSNVTRSARLLGISRRSLQSKMKELGLRSADSNKPSP
jgi:DNA-binding NtrC family response regulator